MKIFLYDGTFEGFLTSVFEIYDRKIEPDNIVNNNKYKNALFDEVIEILTTEEKAKRVWTGLCKKLSKDGQKIIYYAFLSEAEDIEIHLLKFIQRVLASKIPVEQDFGDKNILAVWQWGKKVSREIHRVLMFVRFQKTSDNIYFAGFDPDYDILHLAVDHLKKRFSDQHWVIYDTRRNFGFYYNLKNVTEMVFTESTINFETGRLQEEAMAEEEVTFQKLWKIYFTEMTIEQRKNLKLQKQHMPKRFWKYLVEKW
jgi:probable DNA metabolism protein